MLEAARSGLHPHAVMSTSAVSRATWAALPVVNGASFLEVMEVMLRGLIIICLFWERMVVKSASG